MTPAEFTATRRLIGLTVDDLAKRLGINPRTIRGYESGRYAPSDGVVDALLTLRRRHDVEVDRLATDDAIPIALPRGPEPQGWYVALGARVLDRQPDAMIDWIE